MRGYAIASQTNDEGQKCRESREGTECRDTLIP